MNAIGKGTSIMLPSRLIIDLNIPKLFTLIDVCDFLSRMYVIYNNNNIIIIYFHNRFCVSRCTPDNLQRLLSQVVTITGIALKPHLVCPPWW